MAMNTSTTTTIAPTQQIELTPDGWTLNLYGTHTATITNPNGKRVTNYFGFDDQVKAQAFKYWLESNKYCERCIVRTSERLITTLEVKVWKCPMWLIEDSFDAEIALVKSSPT
jgi:hypothetical protein